MVHGINRTEGSSTQVGMRKVSSTNGKRNLTESQLVLSTMKRRRDELKRQENFRTKAMRELERLEKMKIFLHDSAKIDSTNFRMVDGSGLSRYNLFSASELTTFLEWVYSSQYKNDFISCLPTGGMKNGTMENRLPHLGEMLRVKTGGLSGVTNISGYIFSNSYGPIAFSILTNGYTGDSAPYRVIQDKIIKYMLHD